MAADAEQIIAALRASGGRMTGPKRAVVTALVEAREHTTAEDLAAAVQRKHPDVNESTIYRNLHILEDLGLVEHVHLGHGPAVYHLREMAHHHLVCESCGKVQELPESTLRPLARKLKAEYRFTANPRHFAICGRCEACE
jgi:Fur family ferric uptake transcriptional regulator